MSGPGPAGTSVPTTGPAGIRSLPPDKRAVERRHSRWGNLVAGYLGVVLVLLVLNFALPRLMPGDPLLTLFTEGATDYVHDPELRSRLEQHYGLDGSTASAFATYVSGLARADLGVSIRYQVPVSDLLVARLPRSALLLGTSLALGAVLGVLAGALAGWRRGGITDRVTVVVFTVLQSVPAFFLGSLLVYVFAVRLGWFPVSGSSTRFASMTPGARVIDVAHHLALPASVLASQFAAGPFLLMRAGMVGQAHAAHLAVGRAKGLTDRVLRRRYAARNALLPVTHDLGVQAGLSITAAILVETVFRYEGLGRLMADAIASRDYPLMQGCFLVLTLLVVVANLAADLVSRLVDPRVKAS